MKATILEAYEQGKMLAVLSFVRMLLEPAMDSKVWGQGEEAGGVAGRGGARGQCCMWC